MAVKRTTIIDEVGRPLVVQTDEDYAGRLTFAHSPDHQAVIVLVYDPEGNVHGAMVHKDSFFEMVDKLKRDLEVPS